MTEADDGHGYSKPRRLAAYQWFDRWLKGKEEEATEEPVVPRLEEDLRATDSGQVQTSLGGETVFSLNRARARSFQRGTPAPEFVRRLIGYEPALGSPSIKQFGRLQRDGYSIERLVYLSEPGIDIPALLYLPGGQGRQAAVVYVDGRGKAAGANEAESLVKQGLVVLSIDARGFGETRNTRDDNGSDWPRYFGDYNSAMTALLTGSTLTGGRARDISGAVTLLAARPEVDASRVFGAAREGGGPALMHAAALDSRIRRIALERALESYQSVAEQRLHRGVFEHVINGVLRHYDLPDLARMLAPRPVTIVDAADPMGIPAPLERIRAAYPTAKVVRRQSNDTAATLYGFGNQ